MVWAFTVLLDQPQQFSRGSKTNAEATGRSEWKKQAATRRGFWKRITGFHTSTYSSEVSEQYFQSSFPSL